MNRQSEYERRILPPRDLSVARRHFGEHNVDYSQSDYSTEREQSIRRIRSKRSVAWISLYPSTKNLPPIPMAHVEFNKATRHLRRSSELTHPISPDSFGYASLSQNLLDDDTDAQSPNPVEDDTDYHEGESKKTFDRPLVEVSPGHWTELRGSEETWDALNRNFSKAATCFCCDCKMKVIYDAAMVLCPDCRMINPLDGEGTGLGLGVKVEQKDEILIGSNHSTNSMTSTNKEETMKKKAANLKDDRDSGQSIHRMRERTTNLGPRAVTDSKLAKSDHRNL